MSGLALIPVPPGRLSRPDVAGRQRADARAAAEIGERMGLGDPVTIAAMLAIRGAVRDIIKRTLTSLFAVPQPVGVDNKLAFEVLASPLAKPVAPSDPPSFRRRSRRFHAGHGRGRRARPGPRKGAHRV